MKKRQTFVVVVAVSNDGGGGGVITTPYLQKNRAKNVNSMGITAPTQPKTWREKKKKIMKICLNTKENNPLVEHEKKWDIRKSKTKSSVLTRWLVDGEKSLHEK